MFRIFRQSLLLAMIIGGICHSGLTQAQMRILEADRYVWASASIFNAGQQRREETTGFGSFDEAFSYSFSEGASSASASVSQSSTLPDGVGHTLESMGSTSSSSVSPGDGLISSGSAVSRMDILFTVDTNQTFSADLTTTFDSEWTGMEVTLYDVASGHRFIERGAFDIGSWHYEGNLAAGRQYRLIAHIGAWAYSESFLHYAGGSWSIQMSVVPAPSSLLTLLLGIGPGFAVVLRRRRCTC
jgi:hypothetical protein